MVYRQLTDLDLDFLGEVGYSVQHLNGLLYPLVDDGQVVLSLLAHGLCLSWVGVTQVFEVVDGVHAVLLFCLDVVLQGLQDLGA